jgi:tryptophan synthase alpha chain
LSEAGSALAPRFTALREARRAALIPYVTAGYPDLGATRAVLEGAAEAGADVIELGVPFSDPVADGPVIQTASFEALRSGVTLERALQLIRGSAPSVPVVIMTYLNPVLAFGPARFAKAAREAGASGLLVTDLPAGADPAVEAELGASRLPLIRLVAPTTSGRRLVEVVGGCQGFVYLVARLGVTGATERLAPELAERVGAVRAVSSLPVAVGFGISSGEQARAASSVADGVVVGSAVVERMGRGGAAAALRFLKELRRAMDQRAGAA